MKFLSAALCAAALLGTTPALAAKIDLSTMTCQEFIAADEQTIGLILTWFDGFYQAQDASAVIDTDQFTENAKQLGEYCGANPTIGVGTAAEELFGK